MNIYLIKSYLYGYNDECHYIAGSQIKKIYEDKQEAEEAYNKLEIKAAREDSYFFEDLCAFFDGMREKAEQFFIEKTGKSFESIINGEEPATDLLSDEDLLTFIKLANANSYQLITLEKGQKLFVLWNIKHDKPHIVYDEYGSTLIYEASTLELLKESEFALDWHDKRFKGELSDISHSPLLLESLIKTDEAIQYDEKKKVLLPIKKAESFLAVNALLINPVFNFKAMTLEEIMALEEKLTAMEEIYDEDYDGDYNDDYEEEDN